jgi:hypothetical protein
VAVQKIPVESFKGMTSLPLYNRGPEWLKKLQNMRVAPQGHTEARGGFEKLKPSGGTAANPAGAGIYVGAHEHTMPNLGWIMQATTGGTVFSDNQVLKAWFTIWPTASVNNDALYFGSDQKFSRVVLRIGQGAVTSGSDPTFNYEFWNGSAWTALTLTTTPTWTSAAEQVMEWQLPSTWARSNGSSTAYVSGINPPQQYWVRVRLSGIAGGVTTKITQSTQRVYADWIGDRQLFIASANPASGTNNGSIYRYGQTATTTTWTGVTTSLFSGNYARHRFASYRGVMYVVNGKEQKRWNGETLSDIGFTKPTTSAFDSAIAGAALPPAGTYYYAVTYGYGPNGEWGESNEIVSTTARAFNGAQACRLTFNFTNLPAAGLCDVVYIYRTPDLASVPTTAQSAVPLYRIATVTRDSAGAMPTTYDDSVQSLPFPPMPLNIAVNTPPTRCKFVSVHKNRCFLGSNNQYPGRVWWSEPFQAEAFITDENYADFTKSTGGIITGMVEYNDQMVVFSEDKMFGIANVDTDVPDIYTISEGLGCVSHESIAVSNGIMMWMARNGVYMWDGKNDPQRVSDELHETSSSTFAKMSVETHGLSRAVMHNYNYVAVPINASNGAQATTFYEYNVRSNTWDTILPTFTGASTIGPLIVATAPVGHSDAGVRHPVWGIVDPAGTVYSVLVGEQTTQDDGVNYVCLADVHFGPKGYQAVDPKRVAAVYDKDTGWQSPTLALTNLGNELWDGPYTIATAQIDGGSDYSMVEATFSDSYPDTGDLIVRFSATTTAGGTVGGQHLLAVYLEGDVHNAPWPN